VEVPLRKLFKTRTWTRLTPVYTTGNNGPSGGSLSLLDRRIPSYCMKLRCLRLERRKLSTGTGRYCTDASDKLSSHAKCAASSTKTTILRHHGVAIRISGCLLHPRIFCSANKARPTPSPLYPCTKRAGGLKGMRPLERNPCSYMKSECAPSVASSQSKGNR
jgi:hypothetical protein